MYEKSEPGNQINKHMFKRTVGGNGIHLINDLVNESE